MNFGQAALLYVEGPGTLLKDNLIYEGLHEGVTLEPFPLSGDVDDRLNQTLDSIVEATFNIIIATVPFELIEPVLSRSSDRDLVREGRLWLFTDTYDENQLNSMAEISPNFATLMNGTLRVVTDTGTSSGEGFNRFLNHWPSFEKFRAEIEDILPDGANAPPFVESDSLTFDLPEKLFQEPDMLTPKEAFAYDSTVAAAFALCAADQARVDLRKANDKRAGILAELTKQVEFEGASGHFRLLRRTGSRDPSTLSFALENHIFIPDDKGGYSVNNVVVGAWTTQNSTWQLQEEKIRYYPGNVRVRPLVTDVIPIEDNRVFTEAQIFIFFFAAVIYLMVFGFFSWVMVNYEKPVVRASQPFFLNLGKDMDIPVLFLSFSHLMHLSPQCSSGCLCRTLLFSSCRTISSSIAVGGSFTLANSRSGFGQSAQRSQLLRFWSRRTGFSSYSSTRSCSKLRTSSRIFLPPLQFSSQSTSLS